MSSINPYEYSISSVAPKSCDDIPAIRDWSVEVTPSEKFQALIKKWEAWIAIPLIDEKSSEKITAFWINKTNDSHKSNIAHIQVLVYSLLSTGITTKEDRKKLKQYERALTHLENELYTGKKAKYLKKGDVEKSLKAIHSTRQLLDEVKALSEKLEQYQAVDALEHQFMEACYQPETGDPLEGVESLGFLLSKIATLAEGVPYLDPQKPVTLHDKIHEIHQSSLTEIFQHIEGWSEAVEEKIKREFTELRFQSGLKDGEQQNRAQRQLVSLVTHLKTMKQQIETQLLPSLEKQHPFPQVVESIKSLKDLCKILDAPQEALPLSEESLKYGGNAWKALRATRPPIPKGLFSKVVRWMNPLEYLSFLPENMRPTPIQAKSAFILALVLGAEAYKLSKLPEEAAALKERAERLQKEFFATLPAETIRKLEKETATIRNILQDRNLSKINLEAITARHPEILPTLLAVRATLLANGQKLSSDQIEAVVANHLKTRMIAERRVNHFLRHPSKQSSEKPTEDTTQVVSSVGSAAVARVGAQQSSDPTLIDSIRSSEYPKIQQAIAETSKMQTEVLVHSELAQLQEAVSLLHRELLKSAAETPPSTCSILTAVFWKQRVEDKCYAVKVLEKQIDRLMRLAKPKLSLEASELERAEGGGTKYLNLMKQAKLLEMIKLPGIEIPIPRAINTAVVTGFLTKHAPEVFEEWNKIGALYLTDKSSDFLGQQAVKTSLATISEKIKEVFKLAGEDKTLFKELASPELLEWLKEIKKDNDYLMVRSTGAEDTNQVSNAGGNVSPTYVEASINHFCNAAGDVISSYFSAKSLQNRINAKQNPFEQELKLAVTAQRLIGESVGGELIPAKIPISLVLFSSEPLYVNGEKFRAMRISATLGHGEAVVDGQHGIKTDSVLLLVSEANPDKLYILYENQEKPTRLAPVQTENGVELKIVENPESMKTKPVLTKELLSRLYTWGVVGESFFEDTATDMEIVIKNGKIYPVQARPVNRPTMLPTYLDTKSITSLPNTPILAIHKAEILVPGKASVVIANDPQQILFTATLAEAEKKFIKDKHLAVVVTTPEPANSHPVVNFSSLGIPCLLANGDVEPLIKKSSENTPLVICMQRGTINLWDDKVNLKEHIKKGFAVHPAKIALSLDIERVAHLNIRNTSAPQSVIDLIDSIQDAPTLTEVKANLELLRNDHWVTKVKEQSTELSALLAKQKIIPVEAKKALKALKKLGSQVDKAFDELEAVIKTPIPESEKHLQFLLHLKVLKTLLAETEKGNTLGQYSILDTSPLYRKTQALVDYQKKFTHPVHFGHLLFATSGTYELSVQIRWHSFLEALETQVESGQVTKEQVTQLNHLMHTLEQTGLTTTWFTMFYKSNDLEIILNTISPKEFSNVEAFAKLTSEIKARKQDLQALSQLSSFETDFARTQKLTAPLMVKEGKFSLKELAKDASPMARLVILSAVKEATDLYDTAIKTMKASSEWSEEEKVVLFKKMLIPYFELLENFVDQLEGSFEIHEDAKTTPGYTPWSDKLIEVAKTLTAIKQPPPFHLHPSRGFNVAAVMLGSETYLRLQMPETLEDIFTFTHQSLISAIVNLKSQIYTPEALKDSTLPIKFKNSLELIEKTFLVRWAFRRYRMHRIGFEITGDALTVTYNIPLRTHSARLVVIYDAITATTTMQGFIFGINRMSRWNRAKLLMTITSYLGLVKLVKPIQDSDTEVNFTWEANTLEQCLVVIKEFAKLCESSFQDFNSVIRQIDVLIFEYIKTIMSEDKTTKLIDLFKNEILKGSSIYDDYLANWLADLMTTGHCRSMIIEAAIILFKDGNEKSRLSAIKIFNTLIHKDIYFIEAFEIAKQGLNDSDEQVHSSSFYLIRKLIEKGRYLDDVLDFAKQGLKNRDPDVRLHCKKILTQFLQQNESFNFLIHYYNSNNQEANPNSEFVKELKEVFLEETSRLWRWWWNLSV